MEYITLPSRLNDCSIEELTPFTIMPSKLNDLSLYEMGLKFTPDHITYNKNRNLYIARRRYAGKDVTIKSGKSLDNVIKVYSKFCKARGLKP